MSIFSVSFNDPGFAYSAYYSELSAAITTAGATWTQLLGITTNASIDILIQFDPNYPTADGGTQGSILLGTRSGYTIYQSGAMAKLLTGVDPNGAVPDGVITFGTNYLTNLLWFNPNPDDTIAPIPATKVDAESLVLHELGHVLGFQGYINSQTGALPNNYASGFDRYVVSGNDGTEYFTGPLAEAVYDGPVPLTYGDYGHLANAAPRPGADLIPDLMNGVSFNYQTRYSPSALDVAIIKDTEASINADSVLTPYPNGVYRFFDKNHGTQFLTSSASEKATVLETRRDLVYEGVDLLTADSATDPSAVPVYRFFDTVFGTHFLTVSASERDGLLQSRPDMTYEGIGFYEDATTRPGDNAVYRFFDSVYGTHLYTADASERATILATRPDLKPEGIGFYAVET